MVDFNIKQKPISSLIGMGGGIGGLSLVGSAGPDSLPDPYWLLTIPSAAGSGNAYADAISSDDDGNSYTAGVLYNGLGSGYKSQLMTKVNTNGAIQWEYVTYGSSTPMEVNTCAASDDGSLIICAGQSDWGGYAMTGRNASGTVVFTKTCGPDANDIPYGSVFESGSSNFYMIGKSNNNDSKMFANKWDGSNGTRTWSTGYGLSTDPGTQGNSNTEAFIDSSNNLYAVATGEVTPNPSRSYKGAVIKWNSSGTLQFDYEFEDGTLEDMFNAVAVDESGNMYVLTRIYPSSVQQPCLMKLDSSGTILWRRRLTPSSSSIVPQQVCLDLNGNPIIKCEDRSVSGLLFAKWDKDGVLQWKNRFTRNTGSLTYWIGKMCMTKNGNINFSVTEGSPSGRLIGQIPSDGSLTGTYGAYDYADATNVTEQSYSGWSAATSSMGTQTAVSYTHLTLPKTPYV